MFTARCVKVDEVKKEEEEGDTDLIRLGSQGVCGTGTLQMLVLLCGNTRDKFHQHINLGGGQESEEGHEKAGNTEGQRDSKLES